MQNLNKVDFCIQQKAFIYFIILSIFSFFYVFVSTDTYAKVFDNKNNVSGSYNVILILLDSIRADHLGYYGYNRKTSPAIDKLASEGILFEQTINQPTWSLPSQRSTVIKPLPLLVDSGSVPYLISDRVSMFIMTN